MYFLDDSHCPRCSILSKTPQYYQKLLNTALKSRKNFEFEKVPVEILKVHEIR